MNILKIAFELQVDYLQQDYFGILLAVLRPAIQRLFCAAPVTGISWKLHSTCLLTDMTAPGKPYPL